MTTTTADRATQAEELEAQAAALREAQAAEDEAVAAARDDATLEVIRHAYEVECDEARQRRDTAIEAMNTAAAAGKPLAELYELFIATMLADAECASLNYTADWLDRLDPRPRPAHQRITGYESDNIPRPTRAAGIFQHLTFTDWLSGVERQRRDARKAEADQALLDKVRAAADAAEGAVRKATKTAAKRT